MALSRREATVWDDGGIGTCTVLCKYQYSIDLIPVAETGAVEEGKGK